MNFFKKKKTKASFVVVENRETLHKNLNYTALEQYKKLKTNLNFTLAEGEKCPVVGVTSATRCEGKSTTAINLAYAYALNGSKVALIDGDMRLPSLARKLRTKSNPGLTNLLMKSSIEISSFASVISDNLYVIPSGAIPPNPSELLGSARMKAVLDELKENFDYIIIDLPPVNLVSDAVSVSKFLSGIIIVVREEYTERKELESCVRQLSFSNVNILGFVMNEVRENDNPYDNYKMKKRYKRSGYYRKKNKGRI